MSKLKDIIKKFDKHKILVIGDLMADKYVWGDGLRLSREAPAKVVTVVEETFSLGGAANIARNIKHLGGAIQLVGLVGYDDAAQSFRRAISNSGIDTGGIFPTPDRPTTLKVRIMSGEFNQQLMRVDYEETKPLSKDEKASLLRYITAYEESISLMVFADYEKGIFSDPRFTKKLLQLAKKNKIKTVAHVKPGHYKLFKESSLLICSYRGAREFVYITGNKSVYQIRDIGQTVMNTLQCNALLLVQDGKGLFLFARDKEPKEFTGISPEIFDLTGLEDTIVSAVALSLASGASLDEAVEIASYTFKIVSAKKGSSVVSARELMDFDDEDDTEFEE